ILNVSPALSQLARTGHAIAFSTADAAVRRVRRQRAGAADPICFGASSHPARQAARATHPHRARTQPAYQVWKVPRSRAQEPPYRRDIRYVPRLAEAQAREENKPNGPTAQAARSP